MTISNAEKQKRFREKQKKKNEDALNLLDNLILIEEYVHDLKHVIDFLSYHRQQALDLIVKLKGPQF